MSMYISENEIAIKKDDFISTENIAAGLLKNDYVVMLSREEDLIIINYEWVPGANRNGVVFRERDQFEEEWVEATREAKKNIEWAKSHLVNPEIDSQIDKLANFIMNEAEGEPSQIQGVVDTAIRIIKSYQDQETLSQDWIHKHSYQVAYDGIPDDTEVVYVDDLQNLLMPEQKELEVKIQELIEKYKKEDGKHSNPENFWIDEFITNLENMV